MPQVPKRPLSGPEYNFKRIALMPSNEGVRDSNKPVYEHPQTSLPHPFKCSKCDYIGTSRQDTNNHYDEEHYKESK